MADTQIRTQDEQNQALITDTKATPLSATDQAQIEQTFAEAKDFRQL